MKTDLLIIWSWEHDADFLSILQAACVARGLSVRMVGPQGLPTLTDDLYSGRIDAYIAIDRAWDWGGEYARHCDTVKQRGFILLNDYDLVRRAWHKPTMHYELIAHGLSAPYMIVLPAYDATPEIPRVDLSPVGGCFSVKGAHSGGSGVLPPAHTWEDAAARRREWPSDETIVQTWVEPRLMGRRRAWFRIFYACGSTFLCWADDLTHDQNPVTPEEESQYRLHVLRGITQQIAGLCRLNVFSTEIALDQHNVWQVVDYVNEPCDYRLKSKVANGVPDKVVVAIADRIAGWVQRQAPGRSL
ncbi:MAG: hypothetical protein M1434_13790 [Chloroflexi bacterium]|nr:hypothetical protein [Chloroflexota bacterium]MCL5275794.1 hypothetical protein [Chloroflexota bacterium]